LITSPQIRVAYLVSQYPAANHTFVLREILGLRALGFDVRVASVRATDRPPAAQTQAERAELQSTFYIKPAGLPGFLRAHAATWWRLPGGYLRGLAAAIRLGAPHPRDIGFHLAYFAQAVVFGNWMRRHGLTHVHSHFSSTVAMLAARVFSVTWSATIHGPDEFKDPNRNHLKEKCASALFLVTISNFGREQLERSSLPQDRDRIEVCRLGVDLSMFTPALFRPHPEVFEILFVGRLAPVKAPQNLIAAVGALIHDGRPVRLRLVGDGPLRADLDQQVQAQNLKDHVVLEGPLNQERVQDRLRAADIFAMASLAEGIPVALMEAMAMGIPCIATTLDGVRELIENKVDGILCPPVDIHALSQAIAQLMDAPALRQELGAAGRRRVAAEYDISRNISQLAEIFRSYLSDAQKELPAVHPQKDEPVGR
jgi:glycosyltransferase involved in cell wall biosynthesis